MITKETQTNLLAILSLLFTSMVLIIIIASQEPIIIAVLGFNLGIFVTILGDHISKRI